MILFVLQDNGFEGIRFTEWDIFLGIAISKRPFITIATVLNQNCERLDCHPEILNNAAFVNLV